MSGALSWSIHQNDSVAQGERGASIARRIVSDKVTRRGMCTSSGASMVGNGWVRCFLCRADCSIAICPYQLQASLCT